VFGTKPMQFCELEETLPRVRRVAGRKFADLQTHCCDRPCWLWVQRVACGTDAQSLRRAIGTVGRQDGASGTSGWAPGGDEVGDLRQMDGGEDGRDRVGVVDGRDHDHPPAAVRTTEAIDPPDTLKEVCPGHRGRPRWGHRAIGCGLGWGGDHPAAQRVTGRRHPVEAAHLCLWQRDQGREASLDAGRGGAAPGRRRGREPHPSMCASSGARCGHPRA